MPITEKTTACKFFEACQQTMEYLYARWQDEHEHEDILDYQVPFNKLAAPFGVIVTKMTRRPFGCQFVVDGKRFQLSATNRSYSYKQIA